MDSSQRRVLAHPLRSRVHAELRAVGTATSADLARRLDTHTGATSYHLRRLAEAGLVRDTGTGVGRRRIWEVAPVPERDEPTDDLDDVAAAEWLARDYVDHFAQKSQEWITTEGAWSPSWREACGLDDRLVLVTDEQLAHLRGEVATLLARYRRVGAGNPQAKRVAFYTCALPVDAPRPLS